jgi:hypothetical protein
MRREVLPPVSYSIFMCMKMRYKNLWTVGTVLVVFFMEGDIHISDHKNRPRAPSKG